MEHTLILRALSEILEEIPVFTVRPTPCASRTRWTRGSVVTCGLGNRSRRSSLLEDGTPRPVPRPRRAIIIRPRKEKPVDGRGGAGGWRSRLVAIGRIEDFIGASSGSGDWGECRSGCRTVGLHVRGGKSCAPRLGETGPLPHCSRSSPPKWTSEGRHLGPQVECEEGARRCEGAWGALRFETSI